MDARAICWPREPVAWADAIRRLAENPERAREMGSAGRQRVEQAFTVADHVAATLAVYERVTRRPLGSRTT